MALLTQNIPGTSGSAAPGGIWGGVGALALAIGADPGVVSQARPWGCIFMNNVPIGIATLALSVVAIPAPPGTAAVSTSRVCFNSSVALFGLT